MQIPLLSVRNRLMALCLGLAAVFGCSSLILGYLIERNQTKQAAQHEQYRRFEVIQATQQALGVYRHRGGRLNSVSLLKDTAQEDRARAELEQARESLDAVLRDLEAFDPNSAGITRKALDEIPEYTRRVMAALLSGKQLDAEPSLAELQQRLDLIENTLLAANQREHKRSDEIQALEQRRVAVAIKIAIAIIVGGAVIGVGLVLIVVRSIIRPLQATTAAIRQVNAGQTAIDLPPIGGDEFGDMALALRQFRDHAEKLRRLAYQDPLTGMGNRALLEEQLQRLIDRCRLSGEHFAVLHLDIDKFSSVNEKLGNKAGDRYLCEASARLQRFVPPDAQTFRYTGDKFVALVEDLLDPPELQLREIADCVLSGIAEPYPVQNHLLNMSMSIGIAVFPADGETVEQLISSAEAAVHVAKKNGRNNARFAASQSTGIARRQMALASDIRHGLEHRQFEVFYQPIVDAEQHRVFGAEALLRWRHPERGLLLPGEFIQVAEDEGLINELSQQCLRTVHRQVQAWANAGRDFRISVNLSARQVQDSRILHLLGELHAEDASAAKLIDFELTESLLFDSSEQTRTALEEIKRFGYRLGLDDFGTGYSSFSYLQNLPIEKIKIDRQFVAHMSSSRQALAIVSATLALARSLELEVVAEGVETADQMRLLLKEHAHLQQGFFFSRAIPAADFERWAASFALDRIAS